MTERGELSAEVMCAGAGFHANQTRGHVDEPVLQLTPRRLLPNNNRTPFVEAG
jgi:hypothetical protein